MHYPSVLINIPQTNSFKNVSPLPILPNKDKFHQLKFKIIFPNNTFPFTLSITFPSKMQKKIKI